MSVQAQRDLLGAVWEITASLSLTLFLEIAVHNIVTVNLMQNNQAQLNRKIKK